MTVRFARLVSIVAAFGGASAGPIVAQAAEPTAATAAHVTFSRDVWPIFRQKCFTCHSGAKPAGGLRLDVETHIRSGGDPAAKEVDFGR